MTMHLYALAAGFLLDLLIGDPLWLPHPVRGIGRLIAALERLLRKRFPATAKGELYAGAALAAAVPALSGGIAWAVLAGAYLLHPYIGLALETVLCAELLAARSLRDAGMAVHRALTKGTLDEARRAVSGIVGRDTDRLDAAGVARATVETVAENASDGEIAPLLFMALGGAPLGMVYKAVNTMDSMVGYKNEKYLYFGRAAAKLDDVCNYLPARVAGVLMCLSAPLAGLSGSGAWRVFLRDRNKHASPNSAQTEAACAGALGLRLNGPNYYGGVLVEKPYLGDGARPVEAEDIRRANRLMLVTSAISWALFVLLPLIFL
ncbi:MAG TPA: adenosylcobinamide-phosphate synthase CbiB [Oscillospiraceae bacterium]|nr:cobalamin biosynthesis protein CobD [Oscillospiraceae bacterium]HNW03869.1 adenosylcobinamide-phosphate synthase CbiB [Oscillospiraceae bacterium]